jgi:hypothetical protein
MLFRVFPTVEAPGQARRQLSELADDVDRVALADVMTVVSELVGISVANGARNRIEVSLRLGPSAVDGFVSDDGAGSRAIGRRDSVLVEQILNALADEWRVDEDDCRIWFRVVSSTNSDPSPSSPSSSSMSES